MHSMPVRFLLVVILLGAGCQKKEPVKEKPSPAFQNAREAFFNSLADPSQTADLIRSTSVPFDAALLSDPHNLPSYANDPVNAATNLGIYLADMNYCIAYGQPGATRALFAAAHELSKAIGVEQAVLGYLASRYEANLAQNDSVRSILAAMFQNSTTALKGTEKERFAAFTIAAYQIENLHLLLSIVETSAKDKNATQHPELYQAIIHQRESIRIMYTFLKGTADPLNPENNPNYLYYTNAFEELIKALDTYRPEENTTALHEKVDAIRSKILSIQD